MRQQHIERFSKIAERATRAHDTNELLVTSTNQLSVFCVDEILSVFFRCR